jgi:hypothetical protein
MENRTISDISIERFRISNFQAEFQMPSDDRRIDDQQQQQQQKQAARLHNSRLCRRIHQLYRSSSHSTLSIFPFDLLASYSTMVTNNNSLCVTLGSARHTVDGNGAVAVAADTLSTARTEHRQKQNPPLLDSLQIIVTASEFPKVYSPMDLSAWMDVLNPKARVSVHVLFDNNDTNNDANSKKVLQTVHTSFLLAGLVGTLERKESNGSRVLEASKKYSDQEATGLRAAPIRVSIQLKDDDVDLMDDDDADADLIDEDNLLSDASNLLAPPPSMSAAAAKAGDDCGGRKACDDCSCGRAEAEKEQTPIPQPIKSSSCGKCTMGDAFRCASCPYLGKPAFKAGEEHLVLDLQDDF